MKTWIAGEQLLAADLNANFTEVATSKITVTAAETLVAGDKVGLANLYDGYVSKANSYVLSQTTTASVGGGTNKAVKISTDKVAILYMDNSSVNLSKVVIATIGSTFSSAGSGNAFTFGTVQTVTTTNVAGPVFDICPLGTDKFAVVYAETGAPTVTRLVGATVSGTTITLGTPINLDSAANNVTGVAICQDGTDKCVVSIGKATANQRAIGVTFSGTVPTGGAAAGLDAGFVGAQNLMNVLVGTDKFVVVDSALGKAQCGTLSGTTITLGSVATTITASSNSAYDQLVSPATNVFAYRFYDSTAGQIGMYAATISTRTITFGTKLNITPKNGQQGGLYVNSASEIYCSVDTSTTAKLGIKTIGLSGNTLTDNGYVAQRITDGTSSFYSFFVDMGTYWLTLGWSAATTFKYFIKGMSNNFVGIAQGAAAKGASVSVLLKGTDANQSGLKSGCIYQITAGGVLTQASSFTVADNMDEQWWVIAYSATQIIL